jgi:hypothetical protein
MLGSFLCGFQFDKAGRLVPRRTRAAGSGGHAAPHLISGLYRRPILIDESPQCGPGTIVGAGGASRGWTGAWRSHSRRAYWGNGVASTSFRLTEQCGNRASELWVSIAARWGISAGKLRRKRPPHAARPMAERSKSLQLSQAACLARKCPRAFFPSLVASAMLSKNTGDRCTGADLPAQ